jgi:hypothetical protein
MPSNGTSLMDSRSVPVQLMHSAIERGPGGVDPQKFLSFRENTGFFENPRSLRAKLRGHIRRSDIPDKQPHPDPTFCDKLR